MKVKNAFTLSAILALATCLLCSCSVVMAAKREGTTIENIQCARTRGQLLSLGATIISSERLPTGELVEIYQFKKDKGSAARAFMHGVLDVSTCGLWEIVGTPVEVCMSDESRYVIKVFYDAQESIYRLELL